MPLSPPAIFAIGRNYHAHAREMGHEAPKQPTIFMKNPAAIIAATDDIVIPPICREPHDQVDYEGELGVVISKDACDVSVDDAMSYVLGYVVVNDVTASWWQKKGSGGQWVRGKSFDTFCPISPVTLRDDVADPQQLRIVTTVNGEIRQDGSTADMIFSVPQLIAELSRGLTILAGTLILTGTPSGVGRAMDPPRYLKDGDIIEVRIDGVGTLANHVRCPSL
jgi:2-keto-4-pentenoate hydratase/2-oxohepta-3-ene-1,7-dioic acid hydratase in catechol pathway